MEDKSLFLIFIIIGLIFSPIAALMAYLITYGEYSHHYLSKKETLKISLEFAFYTFCFFLSLTIIVGYIFTHYLI